MQQYDSLAADQVFFSVVAGIHLCSSFMFLKVAKELRTAKARSRTGEVEVAKEAPGAGVGARARLCDSCFRVLWF